MLAELTCCDGGSFGRPLIRRPYYAGIFSPVAQELDAPND
jgi:hypothetical protein